MMIKGGERSKPPPKPPLQSDWQPVEETPLRPNTIPRFLQVAIIAITVVGFLFAARAFCLYASKGASHADIPATNASGQDATPVQNGTSGHASSPPATGQTEMSDGAQIGNASNGAPPQSRNSDNDSSSSPGTGQTNMSDDGGIIDAKPSAHDSEVPPTIHGNKGPQKGRAEEDCSRIAAEHASFLKMPETSVYLRICENVRQCVNLELVALKQATSSNSAAALCAEQAQQELDELRKQGDAPYYTSSIAAGGVLLAKTTVTLFEVITHGTNVMLRNQLSAIRYSEMESACDAAFVTTEALMAIGGGSPAHGGKVAWDKDEIKIDAERHRQEHITKKTDEAHRLECDILVHCIRAWDSTSSHTGDVETIQQNRNKEIAYAKDSFSRMAIYTDTEFRLLLLLVQMFEQLH